MGGGCCVRRGNAMYGVSPGCTCAVRRKLRTEGRRVQGHRRGPSLGRGREMFLGDVCRYVVSVRGLVRGCRRCTLLGGRAGVTRALRAVGARNTRGFERTLRLLEVLRFSV